MKKHIALLLSAALVLALLAGCGSAQTSNEAAASESTAASVSESVQEAAPEQETAEAQPEAPAEEAEESAPAPEPVKFTGTVIPAEECRAEGYDVKYGMFDFETYVELPIVDEPETLTYWMMMQPFMMGYNNVTVDDFTYF